MIVNKLLLWMQYCIDRVYMLHHQLYSHNKEHTLKNLLQNTDNLQWKKRPYLINEPLLLSKMEIWILKKVEKEKGKESWNKCYMSWSQKVTMWMCLVVTKGQLQANYSDAVKSVYSRRHYFYSSCCINIHDKWF